MKNLISLFALITAVFIVSCKKNTDQPFELEPSTWVESKTKKDTIVFTNGFLMLNRPKELTNGYLLPKSGAGPYSFTELKDSIGLQYSISSYYAPKNYAFKIDKKTLYIGDFYEQKNGQILRFNRIR